MEPDDSLTRLQEPTTCPYPEPDQSSPCPPSHFLKIILNITPTWDSQFVSFPQFSPLKSCLHLSSPHTCFMSDPSYPSRFHHRIKFGEEYRSVSSSFCSFLQAPVIKVGITLYKTSIQKIPLCSCSLVQ